MRPIRIRAIYRAAVLWLLIGTALAATHATQAQCVGRWLPEHGVPGIRALAPRPNTVQVPVNALVALVSGEVVVGGQFEIAGTIAAKNIARWNSVTGAWSTMGAGITGDRVNALVVLPDGDVIAGGQFTDAGGTAASNIARYHPATNSWTSMASGIDGAVFTLVVIPGGDLVAGGSFASAGGVPASNIARYHPATNVWSACGSGTDAEVRTAAVLPSGGLIVGGAFTTAGGSAASRVATLDLITNEWSALGDGANDTVRTMLVLPDGNVLLGGSFTTAGGFSQTALARYSPTTMTWPAVNTGVTTGPIYSMAMLSSGDILVGGGFNFTLEGIGRPLIALYAPSTNTWAQVAGIGPVPIADSLNFRQSSVQAEVVLANGNAVVGGFFGGAGASIARYSPSSNSLSELSQAFNRDVTALTALPGGDVVVCGAFSRAPGVVANHLARFNHQDGTWSTLGSGLQGAIGGEGGPYAYALTSTASGDVLVGGRFASAGGVEANLVASYSFDNGLWRPLSFDSHLINLSLSSVLALVPLPNGDVLAGGDFYQSATYHGIARYDVATSAWVSIGSGVGGEFPIVRALLSLPNGDLIVGGAFTTAGGAQCNRIARYVASTGVWSPLGLGLDRTGTAVDRVVADVYALALAPNGDIIVGGLFDRAGGNPANDVARYSPSESSWYPLGSGIGDGSLASTVVKALAVLPSGDIAVGGVFEAVGSIPAHGIARYSISTNSWSAMGTELGSSVVALSVMAGGDLAVGGGYINSAGRISSGFSRWTTRPTCTPDFNCDIGVDVYDIYAFLDSWYVLSSTADFNQNGAVSVQDLFDFLAAYFAGCS